MRNPVAWILALSLACAPALAESGKPQIVPLHPGTQDREGIVIPRGSPLHLASFPRDFESNAVFSGRFALSGAYELQRDEDDVSVTIWPDKTSLRVLPYWRERGGPTEIYISNGWAFARAAASPEELQKLKSRKLSAIRGSIAIVADSYSTSIECDVASFSARFVAVAKPAMKIASNPPSAEGC